MAAVATVRLALLCSAALAIAAAGCPAGEGFAPNSTTCVTCGAGTWSTEGSSKCTRCQPGTWSSAAGADSEDACVKCPRGTWSSQYGSPTQASCQACSAGRWGGSDGLSAGKECTACEPGAWSAVRGATSKEVCTACPKGKWSGVAGARANQTCVSCAPGTWNSQVGASSPASCTKCQQGTFSEEKGARSEDSCVACPVGTYQPAVGQANASVCIRCAPGNYSVLPGAASCATCPPGTWSSVFAATSCNLCPAGKWAGAPGSLRQDQCMPCWNSSDCLEDKSVLVTVEFVNFDPAALPEAQQSNLRAALAGELASACDVQNASVVDLNGNSAMVSLGPRGHVVVTRDPSIQVSAWVLDMKEGLTAQDLAARLYSDSFRATLGNSTASVVGPHAGATVASVSLEPKAFAPWTTSTWTTTRTPSKATDEGGHGMHADVPAHRHQDMRPTGSSGARAVAAPLSAMLLAWAAALGGEA